MELADQVDSLDAVPEPFHRFYSEAEDGGFALDADGLTGAVKNYDSLLGEKKKAAGRVAELEKELKRFEGIDDPEAARKAREELRKAQDKLAAAEAGTTDEEVEKLVETRVERMKADAKAHQEALQKELEKVRSEAEQKDARLSELLIDHEISVAVGKLENFNTKALGDLLRLAREEVSVENGQAVIRDAKGDKRYGANADGLMTVDEWVKEQRSKRPWFFLAGANGGGATGSDGEAGGDTVARAAFDKLPPKRQMELIKKGTRIVD